MKDQLDAEAREAMRQAIAADPDLAREVALRRLEFEVAEALIANQIRAQLHTLRTEPPPEPPPDTTRTTRYRYFFWLIAALLGIAAIGIYRRYAQTSLTLPAPSPPPGPSRQTPARDTSPLPQARNQSAPAQPAPASTSNARPLALATELYQRPQFETLRSTQAAPNAPFEAALTAWSNQEYAAVLSALRPVSDRDPQHLRAATLRAHAQFNLKQYAQAAVGFRAVADTRTMPWAEEADWYLLLAMAANGQSGSSDFQTRLAQLCSDSGHPFADQALELRRRLRAGQ
ncbi:MAG: hypothetical protein IT260_14085 [Saprospiraceae bacterium]|nr:hypothetical protein [Saprospiraceae bacterium]